jgi:hypothetical protein
VEKSIKKQNLSRARLALSGVEGSRDFSTRLRLVLHGTPIGGNDIPNSFQQSIIVSNQRGLLAFLQPSKRMKRFHYIVFSSEGKGLYQFYLLIADCISQSFPRRRESRLFQPVLFVFFRQFLTIIGISIEKPICLCRTFITDAGALFLGRWR